MDASPPDLDALLSQMAQLVDAREGDREVDPGEGNFNCEDCSACYNCRFCESCESCEDCTYCVGCVDCLGCTQSKRSISCEKCSYIEDCRECEGSRYLVLCVECVDCIHCLGCVGLRDAEYCVLNEPVGKKKFYEVPSWVRAEIERRAEQGWRPELIGLMGDDPEAEAGQDPDQDAEQDAEQDAGWDDNPWHAPARDSDEPPTRPQADARTGSPSLRRASAPLRRDAPSQAAPWKDDDAPVWRDEAPTRPAQRSARAARPAHDKSADAAPDDNAPPLPPRMPWEDSQVIEVREPSRPRAPRLEDTPTPIRPAKPKARPDEAVVDDSPSEPEADAPKQGLRRGRRPPRR